jgi:hypothetical protein
VARLFCRGGRDILRIQKPWYGSQLAHNGAHSAPAQAGAPSARFVRDGVERAERGVGAPRATEPGFGAEPHVR